MKKRHILLIMGILFVGFAAVAQSMTSGTTAKTPTSLNEQATRACAFPAGGWVIVDCSNSVAASSAQLNAWSRYIMQCGDDSYFAPGIAASGVDADSSDGWLPSGAWLSFLTTGTVRYMSVLNKNSDSDCRIIECQ